MIRFLTAGESHGKALTAIVEGFPANLLIDEKYINFHLSRRQMGYGRGGRMKIEKDKAEILSGVRNQKTLGSPISLLIKNIDWENWTDSMGTGNIDPSVENISVPRPGHADLTGITKFDYNDIRNSIERSSARETAARVAACSIARKFLSEFGIEIGSYVENIGGVYSEKNIYVDLLENNLENDFNAWTLSAKADKSSVRVLGKSHQEKIIEKIKEAKKQGDTLGGTFVVAVSGIPAGLGSFMHYDTKLNADLSQAIMSINAVKGVEIGSGFQSANVFGSESHDEITIKENNFYRKTNRAGGIEGGISTGLPILMRAAMKPIATLMQPVETIDLKTMEPVKARRERSDFTAVPACAVIAESMTAWIIAKYFLKKFGGDSIDETKNNFLNYKNNILERVKQNFSG